MLRNYNDIRKRLGEPLWFDGNGAPRYDPFTPDQCGIYDHYVALLEVGCQDCGQTFTVAGEWGGTYETMVDRPAMPDFSKNWGVGSFHYGDPPAHQGASCSSGDSMNSTPLAVLEFWSRDWMTGKDDPNKEFEKENPFGWTRHPEYEGRFPVDKGDL